MSRGESLSQPWRAQRVNLDEGFVRQPPLLPWQILFSAFVCGLFAPGAPVPWAAALAVIAGLTAASRLGQPGVVHLLIAFGAGFGAGWLAQPLAPPIPDFVASGEKVEVSGRAAEVEPLPGARLRVILEDVACRRGSGAPEPLGAGLVLTWLDPPERPLPGDSLRFTAKVRQVGGFDNFGGADFAAHWARRNVFFRAFVKGGGARLEPGDRRFGDLLRLRLNRDILLGDQTPSPDAAAKPPALGQGDAPGEGPRAKAFGAAANAEKDDSPGEGAATADSGAAVSQGRAMVLALLTGDRSGLDPTSIDLTRRASLAHSLALSGMHLGFAASLGFILARLAGLFFPGVYLRLARPKLAVLLGAPFVIGYVWLGGAGPSLVRAALMFACWGTLLLLGRGRVLLDGLFFALALMVLADPLAIHDLRLQLSALAVAGIGLFWPMGARAFRRLRPPRRLRPLAAGVLGLLWTSLCAQVALLPLSALVFGETSRTPYLNLVWLPVLGWAVMPLAFAGLGAVLIPGLETAANWCFSTAGRLCDLLLELLRAMDLRGLLEPVVLARPLWPQMLGFFLLLALLAFFDATRLRRNLRLVGLGLALLLAPGLARQAAFFGNGASLTLLDVGQGQAAVLEAPPGRRILVDGGGVFGDFDMGRYVVAPGLTLGRSPELDRVVLTHPHRDHAQGLVFPLRTFQVARVAGNGAWPEGGLGDELARALEAGGLVPEVWRAGEVVELGGGYALEVLWPPGDVSPKDLAGNDGSLVLRLTAGGRGLALLCGDVGAGTLRELLRSGRDLSAEVLVLPHHGSATSHSRRFYAAVAPRAALVSAGVGNAFGNPSKKVLESLARLGCPVYATADRGAARAVWSDPGAPAVLETRKGGPAPLSSGQEKDNAKQSRTQRAIERVTTEGGTP